MKPCLPSMAFLHLVWSKTKKVYYLFTHIGLSLIYFFICFEVGQNTYIREFYWRYFNYGSISVGLPIK